MTRDLILVLLVRYTLVYAGGTTLAAYGVAVTSDTSVPLLGLVLAGVGLLMVATAMTRTTGTGAAAAAIEPASGVHIDPLDFVRAPDASNQLKALAVGAGLVGFGTVLFLGLV